jgi:hypothetical protein
LAFHVGKVLKNDKDFVELAKNIGDKMCQNYGDEQVFN